MMRLPRAPARRQAESTIALINVVFLMLIFFLIAGTLAPPMDREIALVESSAGEPAAPPDALSVRKDGSLFWRGAPTDIGAFMAQHGQAEIAGPVRIAVDRELPGTGLVELLAGLKAAGAGEIRVVTQRGR